ncbi:type II secretion system F family protein [Cellulosimicrobium composti]|uniref:type II secretion system F family protein n=1 Tax=Cellulosimicrobium composti TaxID=2672572 RepID=UPI00379C7204
MTALLLAACVLGATSPWWAGRAAVGRRAALVARNPDAAGRSALTDGGAPGHGSRRSTGTAEPAIETGVLLELLAAAVGSGAAVPRALEVVGTCVGGRDGVALRAAGAALLLGASWDGAWAGAPARIGVVQRALRPAWVHGAAPASSLRAAAEASRQDRTGAAKTAAARLAVHLVLPLGTCFLPAFVLVGLLPVLLSLGAGLLGG